MHSGFLGQHFASQNGQTLKQVQWVQCNSLQHKQLTNLGMTAMRACFFSGKFDTLFFAQTFLDLIHKPICNFGGSYFPAILSYIGFLWIQFSCFFIFFAFHLSQLPPFWCIVMLFLIFIHSHIIQEILHCLKMECRMGILNKNSTRVWILTNGKTGIPRSWLWQKSIHDDISSPSNSNLDSFHSKMHCTCFVEMQLIC